MDGFELAARFSYITNALRYCGPEVYKEFLEYIEHPEKRTPELKEKIRAGIKKFESLYVYLDAIAKKHNKDFLDFEVVEAYWIGNKLLDSFTDDDIKKIINELVKRGLPRSMADTFIERLPKGFKPSHNCHVFYVGVGNVAGTVKTSLQTMDNCRISTGVVVEIIGDKILLETTSLEDKNGKINFKEDNKTAVVPSMIKNINVGDTVALHWGFACVKLDKRQIENLNNQTKHNLEIRNNMKVK